MLPVRSIFETPRSKDDDVDAVKHELLALQRSGDRESIRTHTKLGTVRKHADFVAVFTSRCSSHAYLTRMSRSARADPSDCVRSTMSVADTNRSSHTRARKRLQVAVVILVALAWPLAAALVASDHGARRRLTFNGPSH